MNETYLQLDPDERVLLKVHLHWIHFFPVVISTLLIIIAIAYGLGWLSANHGTFPVEIPIGLVAGAASVLSLFSLLILAISYFVYLQSRLILTNKHMLQINQIGLFSRTVSKLTLDEIQDVRGTKNGFWPTVLNYGEVLIETAGSEPNFLFKPVSNPLNLAETINDAHHNYGHHKQA